MICVGVSAQGKFPLKFIDSRVKINADYYRDAFLGRVVKPSGRRIFQYQP